MATAYLFSHTLTSAEASALDANTPVGIHLDFPSAQVGGNWSVCVTAEGVSNPTISPLVVGVSNISGSGFDLAYATFVVGSNAGDVLRFHVLVQQVQ